MFVGINFDQPRKLDNFFNVYLAEIFPFVHTIET